VADQMTGYGIEAHVFDGSHVEPTDESLQEAIDYAKGSGPWDAFVAVAVDPATGRQEAAVSGDHMLRWPFGIWDGMPALIGSQVRM